MNNEAISVLELSKAYRIGVRQQASDTLVGAVQSLCTAPMRNVRRLRHLRTRRSDEPARDVLWALNDVSFTVAEGEVVGIVGRNGAGKSTLLKILSRITDPTSGMATIRGRVSSLLEVGTGFHPELSGRDNVYMNGTILGMTKREIDRKFDEIVQFSGVEKFLDTPIKRYSSGMQVRLAFAVAAHLDPEILVIDEVLAVGDAEFQRRCIGKMQEVATGGRTVLFVSHNLASVSQLCTSGLLLSDGRVAARGEMDNVLQAYMQELFATSAEVGDDSLRLKVNVAVDGDGSEGVWNYDSTLTVTVQAWSKQPVQSPAVDLYFHSAAGVLLAAQSDRFVHSETTQEANHWCFQFQLKNPGITSTYLTLDAGFRFSCSTRYLGHWRSLAAIAVGPIPQTHAYGRDCPIAVPCEVSLQGAGA